MGLRRRSSAASPPPPKPGDSMIQRVRRWAAWLASFVAPSVNDRRAEHEAREAAARERSAEQIARQLAKHGVWAPEDDASSW
jgi:glutathione S-transferase